MVLWLQKSIGQAPVSRGIGGSVGLKRCLEADWLDHSGTDAGRADDPNQGRCLRQWPLGAGCPPGQALLSDQIRGMWMVEYRRCCWSKARAWWWWGRSGRGVTSGSCCFAGKPAHSERGCPPARHGSCEPGKKQCLVKCSRCSGEGRAWRDPGPTAPTVTPPHHNLRGKKQDRGNEGETSRMSQMSLKHAPMSILSFSNIHSHVVPPFWYKTIFFFTFVDLHYHFFCCFNLEKFNNTPSAIHRNLSQSVASVCVAAGL